MNDHIRPSCTRSHTKLQAVTVCINYSDYLECTIQNSKHFDRWIILTCSKDLQTINLCRYHGVEYHISSTLLADGSDFDAAWNKARVINEGLELLDQDGWALILDSDILLPDDFRRRLDSIPLIRGFLYGARGRRLALTAESFHRLRQCEPWDANSELDTQPLGYLNIFSLNTRPNRYVEPQAQLIRPHDDALFSASFPPEARVRLPFSVLHAGERQVNWTGRLAEHYGSTLSFASATTAAQDLAAIIDDAQASGGVGATIGYFPNDLWKVVTDRCKQLILVDEFHIHRSGAHAVDEADRGVLRVLLNERQSQQCETLLLDEHSLEAVSRVSDASLDILFIKGGVAGEGLVDCLPNWLPKLKDRGLVCGDLCTHAEWPQGAVAIFSVLGQPDVITTSGIWAKRWNCTNSVRRAIVSQESDDGVVIVCVNLEQTEALFLSMYTVRQWWSGPVAVYYWGEENMSLQIASLRLDCLLFHLGDPVLSEPAGGIDFRIVASMQPFRRALLMRPGTLALGHLRGVLDSQLEGNALEEYAPAIVDQKAGSLQACDRSCFWWSNECSLQKSILVCQGDPVEWSIVAWEAWSRCKSMLLENSYIQVRAPDDISIVICVNSSNLGILQHHFQTLRFSGGAKVFVAAENLSEDDLLSVGMKNDSIAFLWMGTFDSCGALFDAIVKTISESRVVFLSPTAAPLPGAELWLSPEWQDYQLIRHLPLAVHEEREISGNVFSPDPFNGLVSMSILQEFATSPLAARTPLADISVFMENLVALRPEKCTRCDMRLWGWILPNTFRYLGSDRKVDVSEAI